MYKHYAKINGKDGANNDIIVSFHLWPDHAGQIDLENDILIEDNTQRQFRHSLPKSWDGSAVVDFMPTQNEIDNINGSIRFNRYLNESNPLYIKWQYELEKGNPDAEIYKTAWLNKVDEIKGV